MGITLRYLAHASFQVKTDEQTIYIDPSTKGTGLKKDDFEPADLILVTHSHEDHFDKKLIKKIRKMGSPVIAPESVKKELGNTPCWTMAPGQFMKVNDLFKTTREVTIWATEAYNVTRFRKPGQPFHPRGLGVGYILKIDEKMIYHAGDTDLIPEMDKIPQTDVALLPSGGTYTMDLPEAAEAAIRLRPKVAVPMHTRDADPHAFKDLVESKSATQALILHNGEEYVLE